MSDTILGSTQAELQGKTPLLVETAAVVSGGLTPASDAVAVGIVRKWPLTMADAQIKANPTTAVALLAAPGAGFWIRVLAIDYSADTSAGAYTNIDASYAEIHVQYAGGSHSYAGGYVPDDVSATPALDQFTYLLGGAGQTVVTSGPYQETHASGGAGYVVGVKGSRSDFENLGLEVKMDNNGTGNLTGGNAANTLKVTVTYVVEPV